MESPGPEIRMDNESINIEIESQSGTQSCSGNILTKLQCIKMPAPDNSSSVESLSSIDSQVDISINNQNNPTGVTQNQPMERDIQTCSGNILTTLQCIKMPVREDDAESIASISSSVGNKSVTSVNDKEKNNLSNNGSTSGMSSPLTNTSRSSDGECSKVQTANTNRKYSNISENQASFESDSSSEIVNRRDLRENSEEKGDIDVEKSVTLQTDSTIAENLPRGLAYNYVRRLLENDPNIDREQLVAILGRLTDTDDDDDDDPEFIDISVEDQPNLPQLYPMGQLVYVECDVCMEKKDINLRVCCDKPVCDDCMLSFITIQVQQAIVKIQCPTSTCDQFVHRDEIMTRLTGEMKDRFYKFLIDANKEAHIKTCPRCSTVMTIDPNILKDQKVKKRGLCVKCNECSLEWCFTCQAPWHNEIKCKQFREGDKLFKRWTKEQNYGQPNARKCPKCKIFIQRSTGCDHMRCTKCNTDFCYQCGERFRSVKFIGDHYSRLSILGCKYRLYPDNPVPRKLIRGSICGAKLLVTPLVAALLVAAGAVILAGSIFIVPVWAGLRIRRHLRDKEARKQARVYREHWEQRRAEIKKTGDPYLEQFNRMHRLGMNPYTVGGSFRKGQGRVLMVDELDMRLPHIQLDELSLNSLDNNQSSTDSFTDTSAMGEQRIKLSPNSLDIHASLDADHHHHKIPEVFKLEPLREVKVEKHVESTDTKEEVIEKVVSEMKDINDPDSERAATEGSNESNIVGGARPKNNAYKTKVSKAKLKKNRKKSDTVQIDSTGSTAEAKSSTSKTLNVNEQTAENEESETERTKTNEKWLENHYAERPRQRLGPPGILNNTVL